MTKDTNRRVWLLFLAACFAALGVAIVAVHLGRTAAS